MKWEKVKYPYIYYEDRKELIEQSIKNFEKFVKYTGVDKCDRFNYGYDISAVFRGENPRYNQRSMDCFNGIDHLRYLYRNSKTGATYALAVPYEGDNISNSEYVLTKFCNKHNISCIILPSKESIYNAPNTNLLIFAHKDELLKLLKKYSYKKEEIQMINPTISFYKYVMKYINVDMPEGDLARDMKDDKEVPKQKDNDREIFSYLEFIITDIDAKRIYKKMKKDYLESKQKIL